MASVEAPTGEALLTAEAFFDIGDLGSCELVEGRIVAMTPPSIDHGFCESNLHLAIALFVREHRLGKVAVGEAGLITRRDPDSVRAADILYISHDRLAGRSAATFLDVGPDLVVEILSPGNAPAETRKKLREYFAIDVRLVWIVDPASRSVFAYRSNIDVRQYQEADVLDGEDVLPGFTLPVSKIFE